MFQNIIVATGGSPWSQNAVERAIQLAAESQQELLIVHILEDDPQYQAMDIDVSDLEIREQFEQTGRAILEGASNRANQAQVRCRTLMQWGSIPGEIVRLASAEASDLIVLGARHVTGDKRLMAGRICNAVLATAPCPVLVVPLIQQ